MWVGCGFLFLVWLACTAAQAGEPTFPRRPDGETNVIADEAGLITASDAASINEIARRLRVDKKIPIVVVTIRSLAAHGAGHRSVNRYATALFDAWGIGFEEHNYGMLLLVAKGDRKARIELGAGWGHAHDDEAREVMDDLIIPAFKAGDFSEGIVSGVEGLDAMARGEAIPGPPKPWWWWPLWIGLAALAGGVIHSLSSQGVDGWGYKLLMFLCVAIGTILIGVLTFGALAGRGGGGSFGGGFSGGGGATGSW